MSQWAKGSLEQVNSAPSKTSRRLLTLDSRADAHERDLSQLGHTQSLSRKFSLWSMLALAFSVLGTWSTFEQDLAGGLTNGGAVTILW